MTRLACPFCGPRELDEFEFHKTVPNAGEGAFAKIYERIESFASSREYWQHVRGCRAWLVIRRDPATGVVTGMRMLDGSCS